MDLGRPLIEYPTVDVAQLVSTMLALPPEFWECDRASRVKLAQDRPGNAVFYFNDAPTFVKRRPLAEAQSGVVNVMRYVDRPLFAEIAELIEKDIAPHFPSCDPMRVQLAELPPGQVILPHKDVGILALIHRLHVPLVTHPDVNFLIEDQTFHLAAGRLYDLNNAVTHSVENRSDATRIHLLVDLLPPSLARASYHDSEAEMVAAVESVGPA